MESVIAGLQILLKYGEDCVCAEHDIIYAGPSYRDKMSDEDKKAMEAAGWHWDKEADSFAFFV